MKASSGSATRRIVARAPIRVADIGGWTDTWFAGHGRVVNVAVSPFASATVQVGPRADRSQVTLDVVDFGDRYSFDVDDPPAKHALLEQCIAEVGVPAGLRLDVSVECEAPAGASTGTSAAVSVALLGALDAAVAGAGQRLARRTAAQIASLAHAVETARLGLQSGIQDQLASAFGGVNEIVMTGYPRADVHPMELPASARADLDRSLVLVYLGSSHVSSDVHGRVIVELEDEGPTSPRLEALRRCASDARGALVAGDLDRYGAVMVANTEAQAALHDALVAPDARRLIDVARSHGARGWKVNGAGGEGGSLTVLLGRDRDACAAFRDAVDASPPWRRIPIAIAARGLTVDTM